MLHGRTYDEVCRNFRWEIPQYYNIGVDVCDKLNVLPPLRTPGIGMITLWGVTTSIDTLLNARFGFTHALTSAATHEPPADANVVPFHTSFTQSLLHAGFVPDGTAWVPLSNET